MHRLLGILVAAALALGAARAADAAITFEFASTCNAGCAAIGLGAGDPVGGAISFADAAIAPNAVVTEADVLAFAFIFGDVDITSASALFFTFDGTLNASGTAFATFVGAAAETVFPAVGDTIVFGGAGFLAGPGFCLTASCNEVDPAGETAIVTTGGTLIAVPEPGTLALLGAGLAGLALVRRRKST